MVSLCFLECKIPELKFLSVTERLALPVSKRKEPGSQQINSQIYLCFNRPSLSTMSIGLQSCPTKKKSLRMKYFSRKYMSSKEERLVQNDKKLIASIDKIHTVTIIM